MRTDKKRTAKLLITLFVIAMLLSAFYMASEAEHDCQGDNCTVCCNIAICKNALKYAFTALSTGMFIFAALYFVFIASKRSICFCAADTLVSLKVKLSD